MLDPTPTKNRSLALPLEEAFWSFLMERNRKIRAERELAERRKEGNKRL